MIAILYGLGCFAAGVVAREMFYTPVSPDRGVDPSEMSVDDSIRIVVYNRRSELVGELLAYAESAIANRGYDRDRARAFRKAVESHANSYIEELACLYRALPPDVLAALAYLHSRPNSEIVLRGLYSSKEYAQERHINSATPGLLVVA